jgi:hypothetical protein
MTNKKGPKSPKSPKRMIHHVDHNKLQKLLKSNKSFVALMNKYVSLMPLKQNIKTKKHK